MRARPATFQKARAPREGFPGLDRGEHVSGAPHAAFIHLFLQRVWSLGVDHRLEQFSYFERMIF